MAKEFQVQNADEFEQMINSNFENENWFVNLDQMAFSLKVSLLLIIIALCNLIYTLLIFIIFLYMFLTFSICSMDIHG